MSYERKREKVKPDMYRVYNDSPAEVIMMVPKPDTWKWITFYPGKRGR